MTQHVPARTVLAVGVAIALCAPAVAQSSRIDSGSVSHARFSLYWETRLDPPAPPPADGFGTASLVDASGIVHRVLLDRSRSVYFGYDAIVQPLSVGNTYAVPFQPLTLPGEVSEKLLGSCSSRWALLPVPAFPAPQTVRGGQVLELNLLNSVGDRRSLITSRSGSRHTDSRGSTSLRRGSSQSPRAWRATSPPRMWSCGSKRRT